MASIIHAMRQGFKYYELADGALVEFGPGAQVARVTLKYERGLSLHGICSFMLATISTISSSFFAGLQAFGDLNLLGWVESARILFAMVVLNMAGTVPDRPKSTQNGTEGDANGNKPGQIGPCPICTDSPEDAVAINCGHLYCKGRCFEGLCMMITDHKKKQEPIHCEDQQSGKPCNSIISLVELQRSLPKEVFTQLLQGSFNTFLLQHPQEYGHCASPDCDFVYRRQKGTFGRSPPSVRCTRCMKDTCTRCGEQHAGTTCEMHEKSRSDEKAELDQLMREEGIKQCSSCNAMISKNGGCDHMECIGCSAHLCWVCLRAFDTRRDCEDHLKDVHDGIFPEGYNQDDAGDGFHWEDEEVAEAVGLDWDDENPGIVNVVRGAMPWTQADNPEPQRGNWDHHGAW